MRKLYNFAMLFVSAIAMAQAGAPAAYYNGFNWVQTGTSLKNALAAKITGTHTRILSYANAERGILVVDLDPADATNTNLLMVYGFSNNTCPSSVADDKDHRTRNKTFEDVGTNSPCVWNKEHTFARNLGTTNLEQTDANSDVHHLRASDKERNADRGNKKFAAGSGNSGNVTGGWYPGDEWKGDVARMMMYMYLRYPVLCPPTGVGTGATVATDPNMLSLFLQWNAEDPVSTYEDKRNTYLGTTSNSYGQGNRNPFIDNPYLATLIWGGTAAENRWPFLETEQFDLLASVSVYPNPSNNHRINIETEIVLDRIQLVNINGQIMQEIKNPTIQSNIYTLENLPSGFYFLKLTSESQSVVKKIIVN